MTIEASDLCFLFLRNAQNGRRMGGSLVYRLGVPLYLSRTRLADQGSIGVETQVATQSTGAVLQLSLSASCCSPLQMEFAVQMTRESCVDEVKKSLQGRPGDPV